MIIVYAYKVVGNYIVLPKKEMLRFDNNYRFPFDINDPEQWRLYLSSLKLPRKSKEGLPVHYHVQMLGGVPGKRTTGYNLFPGKNPDGSKRKIAKYGGLM